MQLNIEQLFLPLNSILNAQSAQHFLRLGLCSVIDLLLYQPFFLQKRLINPDLSYIKDGDMVVVKVKVQQRLSDYPKSNFVKRKIRQTVICGNDTGTITLNYFREMPQFISYKFKIGNELYIAGVVNKYNYQIHINHPEILPYQMIEDIPHIVPIYHLTYGLTNQQVINSIDKMLKILAKIDLEEWLPSKIVKTLPSFKESIYAIHQPASIDQKIYLRRIKYDELFAHYLALRHIKKTEHKNLVYYKAENLQSELLKKLGFDLTTGQRSAIAEIEHDQSSNKRMMRLLQGDVGSGKTLVALLTMLNAVAANLQTALMAPTDILAVQHYEFFSKTIPDKYKIALLTGKTKQSERKKILQGLKSGEISILIGTHAIFQEEVVFKSLGYAVIDEQHKFGVKQRMQLLDKGEEVDLLIMTATPIPRSLSIAMFGDIDISTINSKPKNRKEIKTSVMNIEKAHEVVESLKNIDGKIYWVCPLVEESEELDWMMSAKKRYELLRKDYNTMLIHGQMSDIEKENAMLEFKNGSAKILVATTVIEVGIDVPDACLIVIEHAERFGLAALHQLRGRVGRGEKQSFCILLYDNKISATGRQRLMVMKNTTDGFEIAKKDLELRGAGEVLGVKQSGEQEFRFLNIQEDQDIFQNFEESVFHDNSVEKILSESQKNLLKIFGYHNLDKVLS